MKVLLNGDEAIARGAWEAGVKVAAAYPGTPSTEILESMSKYEEVKSQWSVNEKVAVETAAGASLGGARTLVAMKHVGLNVAADPFFTMSYIGVRGGMVIVTADDPSLHSSQNEQDNRHYARAAKVPLLEPSDSQEALEFTKEAFEISEKFDTPVLLRITTRIAHSMTPVELGERKEVEVKPYLKDFEKAVMLPVNGRKRHILVEERTKKLYEFAANTSLNRIEWGSDEIGIVTSGVSYQYVKEVFPDATVVKYGFTWPFNPELAREVRQKVKKLYVVEEGDPYIEEHLKAAGIKVDAGKDVIPMVFELNPQILREKLLGEKTEGVNVGVKAPPRPPSLCPGCGHRGLYYAIKRERAVVFGDIGCYTLAALPPLSAMDTCICMGASISGTIGLAKAQEAAERGMKKVACTIGDSTFIHSGITGLIDAVYNNARFVTIVLDNSITAMTGHQPNPVTGQTIRWEPTAQVDLVALAQACGIPPERISVVDTYDVRATRETLQKHWEFDGPSFIVAKSNCVIATKWHDTPYVIETDLCKSCGLCVQVGCAAISYENQKAAIERSLCVGCSICAQVCPWNLIHKETEPYEPVDKPIKVP